MSKPKVYWSTADIAALFSVPNHTVSMWLVRYGPDRTAAEIAKAPVCPQPDIILGVGRPNAGWDPDTAEARWRTWRESLPGRGAGGGRPPRQHT